MRLVRSGPGLRSRGVRSTAGVARPSTRFEVVARRAFTQATPNPVGLLLWMLDRRHHEAAELALERAESLGESQNGKCYVCEAEGRVFAYAGQWFCETHRDEQEAFYGAVRL